MGSSCSHTKTFDALEGQLKSRTEFVCIIRLLAQAFPNFCEKPRSLDEGFPIQGQYDSCEVLVKFSS